MPDVVDRMIRVPDAAALATIRVLERLLNRKCGGSTGTNVYAALQIAAELDARGQRGSVVSMICDSGERYLASYYSDDWIAGKGFDLAPWTRRLEGFLETGELPAGDGASRT